MTKERAQEIATFLAGKSHRMSGKDANNFFQIYKNEINPKAKTQPCNCAPNEWKRMLEETYGVIDNVLKTETISLVVYEVPGDTQDQVIDDTIEQPTQEEGETQDKPKGKRKIEK